MSHAGATAVLKQASGRIWRQTLTGLEGRPAQAVSICRTASCRLALKEDNLRNATSVSTWAPTCLASMAWISVPGAKCTSVFGALYALWLA